MHLKNNVVLKLNKDMNELEKTLSQQENATPEPVVNTPEETKSQEQIVADNKVVTVDNELNEVEEPESLNNELDADDSKIEMRQYFAMSKEELLATLNSIVENEYAAQHKEVNAIKQAYYAIRKKELEDEAQQFVAEGGDQTSFSSTPDPSEAQFKELLAKFKDIRAKFLEEEEARRQENLSLKIRIIDQLKEIVEDIDNINLHFSKFQQLQQDFKNISEIPAGAVTDTWKQYQLVVEQFYDRLKMNKELRDLDFKKNLIAKRDLIDSAKALEAETDIIGAFKKLQILHEKWRELGPVAKELREDIWNEFKDASTIINKRHQEYFEGRKEEERINEEAKTKICEEIEAIDLDAIKSFNAWDETTKTIIDMQEKWKTLGFASRKVNNQLFLRFRKSCDEFFSRKAEYFKKTKEDFARNLEKKIALCEKAEALKESETDIKKATEEIVKLQAEWKKIGSVARKHSDAVWQRFMSTCNYFFDARKKQNTEVRQGEQANLVAKREIIATLTSITSEMQKEEVVKLVRELQQKWQTIGHVPYKMKDKVYDQYREALKVVYDLFDIKETRAKMTNFENQIEEIKGDENKLYRERERLLRSYEQKRGELKTYENNMGFFNITSKAGNSMLKELERKTQKIKEEMELIEKKIALLDSKFE